MMQRPPLGLLPRHLHIEFNFDNPDGYTRFQQVNAAITRYKKAGLPINPLWIKEQKELQKLHKP